jgi:hypothetical protein
MIKRVLESNDPYTGAIKSLVIKTIAAISIMAIILIGAIGYIVLKKTNSRKAVAKVATVEQTSEPTSSPSILGIQFTPIPSLTPLPSPSATATQTPSATPTSKPSSTATPTPSAIATKTSSPTTVPTSTPASKSISATNSLEGYIASNGEINSASEIKVGSSKTKVTRGFLSFDITSLKNSSYKKYILKVYQAKVEGNPYTTLGQIKIDTLNYGSTFDNSDYSVSSSNPSFATISDNSNIEWKNLDITSQVAESLSKNQTTIQFRLHFTSESFTKTDSGDFALFESSENSLKTGNVPSILSE